MLKQTLSQLRVKAEWFSDPARIHAEALALHWMSVLPPGGSASELLFADVDRHIAGMRAVALLHGRALTLKDDFPCTNPQRIRRAIDAGAADALLLKVNQIGTVTEAWQETIM